MAVTAKRDIKRVRDIRDLLSNKKLTASFQQIVSVSRKTVVGAEGLIRCANTLTGENIVPFDLFAEAGAAHLTLEMDRVCRATILEEFSAVHRDFPDKLLFLNINTAILDCSAGSGYLLEQVRRSGINPRNIVIEISEINVLSNAILKRFVDTYKHYGFMVALDDVGTGFSNMDRILLVRPDIIKIDRSLVKNIHIDFYRQGVFKSLIILANKIGALVIAEGVELEEEAIQVLRLGSHMIQGFYFSVPAKLGSGEELFASGKIDLLGRRFSEYIHLQNIQKKNKNKRLMDIVNRSVMKLADRCAGDFDDLLGEIVSGCPAIECAYILDGAGVQISGTICSESADKKNDNLIFYAAKKGTDHSMEKYYYQLAGKRRKRCATEPYVSLATGNLCTTVSTVFADSRGERCIVCVDFKTDEDFYNIELRGLAVRSPVSAGADMNGMLTTLGEEIIKDSLTGAYNRRYIEERLPVDLYNAATGNRPLSVILIDIDRFKDVNDRFGHLAGDHVLKEFVTISRRCVRSDHDWVARYGGDEFLFVLGSANETAAVEAAEKIRTACARASVRYDGKTLHFTVSLGICTADAPQATVDELIGKADRNLYNAKKSGRNRTVHGSAELEKSS